jgi:hypothetical protein
LTSPATATLVGGIIYLGGMPPGLSERDGYQPGVVEVLANEEVVARQRVAKGEGYRFDLPAGEYTLSVRLGDRTETWQVTLIAGEMTHQDAVCAIR